MVALRVRENEMAMQRWQTAAAMLAAGMLWACGAATTPPATVAADVAADAAVDAAADATATGRADLTWPPDQTGPYHVGYRTFPLTYVPAPDGVTRTIQVSVWYPTNDATGTPAVYFAALPVPEPDVFQDASLAPPVDPAGYPVHEFTHGHLGFAGSAPYMVRHFASHGWVVIAADHTGNTLVDNAGPRPPAIYWWRQTDDEACLNWLETLPPSDPLYGKARTEKVFLSGHSFGSTDVWSLVGVPYDMARITANCAAGTSTIDCSAVALAKYKAGFHDARIVGAAQLAGGVDAAVFAPDAPTAATLPLLVMTGTADTDHPSAPLWDPLPHGWWVEIAGACHQTFGLGDCAPPMTADVGTPIVWTYTLALARRAVLGDSGAAVSAILDGAQVVSPLATLHKK